jgi:hypothetical protein
MCQSLENLCLTTIAGSFDLSFNVGLLVLCVAPHLGVCYWLVEFRGSTKNLRGSTNKSKSPQNKGCFHIHFHYPVCTEGEVISVGSFKSAQAVSSFRYPKPSMFLSRTCAVEWEKHETKRVTFDDSPTPTQKTVFMVFGCFRGL